MKTKEIVNKAIDYIINNLEQELSIESVADHCHFSKYYFSRVFKAETGESIYGFIKRLKVERSTFILKVDKDRSITDIGYQYGYNPSSYSTLFKKHHQMSPYAYRKSMVKNSLIHPFEGQSFTYKSYEEYDANIKIVQTQRIRAVYERHIGSYKALSKHWQTFINKYKHMLTDVSLFIEQTYDDPSITDVD